MKCFRTIFKVISVEVTEHFILVTMSTWKNPLYFSVLIIVLCVSLCLPNNHQNAKIKKSRFKSRCVPANTDLVMTVLHELKRHVLEDNVSLSVSQVCSGGAAGLSGS